jgi:proteasome beta subunit
MERDAFSGNGILVAVVSKEGFKILPEEEVKSRLRK